jgi:hypothetical protein
MPSLSAALLTLTLCAGGCVNGKTVFVREGEPVILAEKVRAKVFYRDPRTKELTMSKGRMELQPGWIVLPPFPPPVME